MNSDEISAALGRLGESIPKTLDELADAFAGGVWSTVTLRHSLIELLEQADPHSHMELPLDEDGRPVHMGDAMQWCGDGHDGEVLFVCGVGGASGMTDPTAFYIDGNGDIRRAYTFCMHHYQMPPMAEIPMRFPDEWEDAMTGCDDVRNGGPMAMTDDDARSAAEQLRAFDADGVPVHIGDKVTSDEYPDVVATVTQFVPCAICEGIRYTRDGSAVDEVVKYSCYAHKLHHHHSKTVEDVLTEAITAWINPMHKGNVVAEYAAKLREAMRNE